MDKTPRKKNLSPNSFFVHVSTIVDLRMIVVALIVSGFGLAGLLETSLVGKRSGATNPDGYDHRRHLIIAASPCLTWWCGWTVRGGRRNQYARRIVLSSGSD
jgi:hypothetical protein